MGYVVSGILSYWAGAHVYCTMAAGETTATTLTMTLYLLLTNPDVLAELIEEVRSAHLDYAEITISSASQLPYLAAVIKESMRLWPVAPLGRPRVSPGTVICGHYVPSGVCLTRSSRVAPSY